MYFTAKNQEHAGDPGAHEQPIDPILGHDAGHDHYKRACRAANLHARSTQRGDQKSRDHRAVQPSLRWNSTGNRKGHSQRQRHQAHGHARNQVRNEVLARVVLEGENGFRDPFCAHRASG
jgi:hypothetical protein